MARLNSLCRKNRLLLSSDKTQPVESTGNAEARSVVTHEGLKTQRNAGSIPAASSPYFGPVASSSTDMAQRGYGAPGRDRDTITK